MARSLMFVLFLTLVIGQTTATVYAGETSPEGSIAGCPGGCESLESRLIAMEDRMLALEADNAALKAMLEGVSRTIDTHTGQDTLRFSNMNVQVVSGSGATDDMINGTGNLIIGYNEKKTDDAERSGSHMLVIGRYNNYSTYGGMVVGTDNAVHGEWASVSGGSNNTASGGAASVGGGHGNTASNLWSVVSGGAFNMADGSQSSVNGGYYNKATGAQSSVTAGSYNHASGTQASVSGGMNGIAATTACLVGDDGINC